MDVKIYPFASPAGCRHRAVSLSMVNTVNVRMYPFPPPAFVDMCISFHSQQCGLRVYSRPQPAALTLSTFNSVSLYRVNSVDVRVYPCLQSILWSWECFPFHHQQRGREGGSFSTKCSVDVQGVSLYITCSVAVQGVSMSTAAAWMGRVYSF